MVVLVSVIGTDTRRMFVLSEIVGSVGVCILVSGLLSSVSCVCRGFEVSGVVVMAFEESSVLSASWIGGCVVFLWSGVFVPSADWYASSLYSQPSGSPFLSRQA